MEEILIHFSLIIAVVLGGVSVVFFHQTGKAKETKLMLAFSGGFLLSMAFIHFIPELYATKANQIGLFILLGFLIQLILEFFSGGIEHGHAHVHEKGIVPISLLIALSIHAFLEGVPIGGQLAGVEIATNHHHESSNGLFLGVLLHRIPVAIALMTLLISSEIGSKKSWIILGLFSMTTSIGILLGKIISFEDFLSMNYLLAIVVGMFLHISTTIIFETSEGHKFNFVKLMMILSGCILTFLIH